MKKLLVFGIAFMAIFLSQRASGQFTELKAGVNFATIHFYDNQEDISDEMKRKPGYHVSILYNFPVGENLAIKTGGQLVLKGMKTEYSESYADPDFSYSYSSKTVINLTYLEVPVLLTYTTSLGKQLEGFVTAGPYAGVGISGKGKYEAVYNGEKETDEMVVEWGNTDEDDLKRLDLGLHFGIGLAYRSFVLETSYSMGLNNLSPYDWDDFKMSNRDFRIGIGYRFVR